MSQDSIDPPSGTAGPASESGQPTSSPPNTNNTNYSIFSGTINTSVTPFDPVSQPRLSPPPFKDAPIDPASQPPPSLPPFNDAPIDRISSCFTGREPELEFISTSFNTFQSDSDMPTLFVIWGMPGLGKSQLALQHANLAFTSDVYSHIFYVSASTAEKLYQGLARILDLLNHPDRNHPDQAVQMAAVRLFFEQSDRYGCHRWLLMVDDVTVESISVLREHLPRRNANGSILFTTRTLNIAEAVASQEHRIFELKALSKAQSVSLLLRRAGIQASAPADLESAEKLVSRMGCLPLAIEQAGSYMKQSGLQDVNQLQRMSDERELNKMISWDNNLTTYQETSVLTSITVQLQKLDEIDPDANKLLKMLAFFDPERIPIDILSLGARSISDRLAKNAEQSLIVSPTPKRQVPATPNITAAMDPTDPLESVPADLRVLIELICSEERVRAALHHFEDLSIAQPLYNDKPSLHIHNLIQLVFQQSTLVGHEEGYRALAIALLCNAFQMIDDPEEPHSWAECEIFVPHFAALSIQDNMYPMASEEYMDANESLGHYLSSRGRYSEAETVLDRVLANRRRLLSSDNIQIFYAMDSLARVYSKQGKSSEAESLFTQALAAAEKQLGGDHPSTLETVNSLAGIYTSQGEYNAAENLYARALAGQEKQLGGDHPSTLATMNELAGLYVDQGRFSEAKRLYAQVLAGQEKQLGADHPSTLATVNNLAGLYMNQGKFDEAESFSMRALAGFEMQLGPDHPDTQAAVNQLAHLCEIQGRFKEAENLYARSLAGEEQQLGPDHPSTLATVNNLAHVYKNQGRFDEAESLYARALAGFEMRLGPNHPSTLAALNNLSLLHTRQFDDPKQELAVEEPQSGLTRDLRFEGKVETVAKTEIQMSPEGSNLEGILSTSPSARSASQSITDRI
ncbi:TPR-like protein [Athelia psychrophila]|uniref:TPR-like protein n=1 Tax=Athelia psychrophila TaxID=1759441 RepID=A0A166XCZ4_9AGAM|nr:TPR-like protein [Fibularhizoctonia sp. CBS 109695]